MRSSFTLLVMLLWGLHAHAQPANDNCDAAIPLGTVSALCNSQLFTNVNATTSNIGPGNNPTCFNGGTTQRDVWFTFTTNNDIRDLVIQLQGTANGPNGQALRNPQIALYRGDCNRLSEIDCFSAPNGVTQINREVLGLTPNTTYFLRVNDYSPTAAPNSGDFLLCVRQFTPAINMGQASGSTACFGTLYDSGGPTGDYRNNENLTFTICPSEPHACIELNVVNFSIEPALLGFVTDVLTIYEGNGTSGRVLSTIYGQSIGTPLRIQAPSGCVTVRFQSDFIVTFPGFELTWQCSSEPCENRSIENPEVITSLPFNGSRSTCESASTFSNSPCTSDLFLNGPEYVFAYNSNGNVCVEVAVSGATAGTGVLILNGRPDDPNTICVARGAGGNIASANLREAGTYYIVVAHPRGCTNFNIRIVETTCTLSPALLDALCNPLNGCIRVDGLPTIFNFEKGFQDMEIEGGVNNGCWLGYGVEPSFYWFTVQAQAQGRFGFLINSANIPSDLDFNVWGPFRQEDVCNNKQAIVNTIRNTQPIRSSWSPTPGLTGLTDVNPRNGRPVLDVYDCGNTPGAAGDDFVRTIAARQGDVYVVLINDWGNLIDENGVEIDWSPSDPPVLEQLPSTVVAGDTAICKGESVQIRIESAISSIRWLNDTNTLSCDNCPNPIATPTRTTIYRALVEAVCYKDTIEVKVEVFDANLGEDVTVCRGERFELVAGSAFANATYSWSASNNIQLSCNDCPNPTINTPNAGVFDVAVTLTSPNCIIQDTVRITVRPEAAPQYFISPNREICAGETVNLGGTPSAGVTYTWTSVPPGFASNLPNPQVSPTETTTYYLSATNAQCPLVSRDSVTITVFQRPVINVATDTSNLCQEEPIQLGNMIRENDVRYEWVGPDFIQDASNPNTIANPASSGTYTLTATRGVCVERASVNVLIIPIDIKIQPDEDTIRVCRDEPLNLIARTVPTTTQAIWTPNNGSLSDTIGNNLIALPRTFTTYTATVTSGGCVRVDSIVVLVDSLPGTLRIEPIDTSVCEGSLVILKSKIYEPSDFPDIKFRWEPSNGQQTPDSLYNMVISADTTTLYYRISTNGACVDTTYANVMVKPIPIARIVPADTTVCIGQPVRLRLETTPENVDMIEWMPTNGISCTNCKDPIVTTFNTQTYTAKVELDNCPSEASATVNIFPTPQVVLPSPAVICLGESIQLNLAFTPGATYTWTSPDNPAFSSNDPRPVVSPTTTTTYRVVAQFANCTPVERTVTITVVQPATLTINAPEFICQGESAVLSAVSTVPASIAQTFRWEWNGLTSSQANLTVNGLTADTDFRLTYTYGPNCGTIVRTVRVEVKQAVVIESIVTAPDSIYSGQTVTLTANTTPANPSGATYAWSANGSPIAGTGPITQHRPIENPTQYEVVVTSANGCISRGSISLTVLEPEYRVPNAFTPNGDGRNDFFNVITRGIVDIVQFRVFNRWGQIVYNNNNPGRGWDGNFNGRPAPSDVYVYYIIIRLPNGREDTLQGDVTLLR